MFLGHPCRCVCWVETRPQPWQLSLCWEGLTRTLQYKDNSQQQSDTYPAIQRQQSTVGLTRTLQYKDNSQQQVWHVPCNTKTTVNSSLTYTLQYKDNSQPDTYLQYKNNSQQQSDMYPAIQKQQTTAVWHVPCNTKSTVNSRSDTYPAIQTQHRTDLGKCTHLYDKTQGTMKHKYFWQKIVFVRYKKIDNNKRRRKQRRRQTRSWRKKNVNNVYVDLKHHQNDEN